LPQDFTPRPDVCAAFLIGVNCGVDPTAVLEALERMVAVTGKKHSAEPNAGFARLAEKLAGGESPVLVEDVPPKGSGPTNEVKGVQYLLTHVGDIINIRDSAGATASEFANRGASRPIRSGHRSSTNRQRQGYTMKRKA
jgi:hypothetical protein